MNILTWDNQQDAEDSLALVNATYGCPYEAENGYRADEWARVIKSPFEEAYGFFKPEAKLGCDLDGLMAVLVPGFAEKLYKVEDFYLDEDLRLEP